MKGKLYNIPIQVSSIMYDDLMIDYAGSIAGRFNKEIGKHEIKIMTFSKKVHDRILKTIFPN